MLDEPDDAIRFEKPYLPEKDISVWQFVQQFERAPTEVRSNDGSINEENKLAQYIRKNKSKLHSETVTMLNMFTASGGCIAQAKDDLQRLLLLDDPPDELVRCLRFIVQCPSYAAMKYNEDGSESQIWKDAGEKAFTG